MRKSLRSRLALLFAAAVGASLLASGGATIGVLVLQARTDREMELARGLPADDDDELAIQKAAVAMAIVAPLAMGAAALFGLLLARRALRPMRQASDRARAARASELDLTCSFGAIRRGQARDSAWACRSRAPSQRRTTAGSSSVPARAARLSS